MRARIFNTFSAQETQKLAGDILAGLIKDSPKDKALVLALMGDLGSGKTTFTQGIAKALGILGRVASPTFVLMHRFKNQKSKIEQSNYNFLIHIDAYRLSKPEEILELGFQEIISDPKNIVVIEWPEKIKNFLPKQTHFLKFKFINETQREIKA
ncbi:MAG: tRNA (adenosine(37)-N6)-threonylcarbamoyltransferase complex ATPase subunit type 1 TsaE [Candidatus Pacebacteria bacterium]|nr:tRNA (adenosine(37)-N6)-threonylcarbamoyltransferase complex ATPase subunit type 1 TsaE [Candidatus Paceibacterota bacterium]